MQKLHKKLTAVQFTCGTLQNLQWLICLIIKCSDADIPQDIGFMHKKYKAQLNEQKKRKHESCHSNDNKHPKKAETTI